jgi:RNA polymerase sigma factor (sigma-70 family)
MIRLRTDDQLVLLFRKGYDEAFDVIDGRYRPRLIEYARGMLGGSRADAEDAIQDVFLSAYRALRRDDRPLLLRAWLYRIAHNRCIDQVRRPAPAAADLFDVSRMPPRDPVIEAERRESVRCLMRDMGRLPEQQRSALLMRQFEGLSYAEIATALALSQKAVKSLLVRARMGLAAAHEARNAPCLEIRSELAVAFERGVRMTGRSRLHLLDCAGCRAYRHRLRAVERTLGAASAGHGVIATIAKLLGIGGAGSGAAIGAGTVAVGGPVVAKITALVCCGVAAAGVAEFKAHPTRVAPEPSHHRAIRTAESTRTTPRAAVLQHVDRRIPTAAASLRARPATTTKPPDRPTFAPLRPLGDRSLYTSTQPTAAPKPITPGAAARGTGGALAPDDPAPAPPRDAPTTRAAPSDAPSTDPPADPAPAPPATTAAAPTPAPAPPGPPPAATTPATPAPTEPTGGVEAPPSAP